MKTKVIIVSLLCFLFVGNCKCLAIENEKVENSNNSFTISWNVLKAGDEKSIELNYEGVISIDWGDGKVDDSLMSEGKNQVFSHTYKQAKQVSCTISGGNIFHIKCDSKKVFAITLTNVPNLEYLSVKSGKITKIDVSNLSKLETFYCDGNDIEKIDLSNNTLLESLNVSDNKLTTIDLSELKKLKKAYIDENEISNVLVCSDGDLSFFNCSDCNLSANSLNELFDSLPKLDEKDDSPSLFIQGNPGVVEGKIYDIPKSKNWLVDVNVEEVKLIVDAKSVKVGEAFNFSIKMSSKYQIKGVQFDLVLPHGVDIDEKLTDECYKSDSTFYSIWKLSDENSYRIIIFSMYGKAICEQGGKIISFVIPSQDSIIMDKDIKIENEVIGDINNEIMQVDITNSKYQVQPQQGDIDGNYVVNIADVMCLVDIINGVENENIFTCSADLDKNEECNVLDILLLVDEVMASNSPNNRSMNINQYNRDLSLNANSLYFKENKEGNIDLCMKNNINISAFQIDMSLDPEIKINDSEFKLSKKRAKDYISVMRCIDKKKNIHRLLVYSMVKNRSISANDANYCDDDMVLGTVKVINKGNITKESKINSVNSLLVLPKNKTFITADCSYDYSLDNINSVDVITTNGKVSIKTNGDVKQILLYDLSGQSINIQNIDNLELETGVYFIVVKFNDGKKIRKKFLVY